MRIMIRYIWINDRNRYFHLGWSFIALIFVFSLINLSIFEYNDIQLNMINTILLVIGLSISELIIVITLIELLFYCCCYSSSSSSFNESSNRTIY